MDGDKAPKTRRDGKVLNPQTGEWVSRRYAKKQGILEQAYKETQKYFQKQKVQEDTNDDVDLDNPPQTTGSLEDVADNFEEIDGSGLDIEVEDEEGSIEDFMSGPDHGEHQRSQEDSEYMSEEEFMEFYENKRSTGGERKSAGGIYTTSDAGRNTPRSAGNVNTGGRMNISEVDDDQPSQKDNEPKYKYVQTERGGMKKVRIDDEDD